MSLLSERVWMASSSSSALSRPEGRTTLSISDRLIRGSRTADITSRAPGSSLFCLHQRHRAWKISLSLAANESLCTTVSRADWKRAKITDTQSQSVKSSVCTFVCYNFYLLIPGVLPSLAPVIIKSLLHGLHLHIWNWLGLILYMTQ